MFCISQSWSETLEAGPLEFHDKMPLKKNYADKGIRVVPHAVARHGAFISSGVILMPSYVNIGAYVDEGTMVDTWATVGSCAQIGKMFIFQRCRYWRCPRTTSSRACYHRRQCLYWIKMYCC